MKVPIEWLKNLVSFRAGLDQLAKMLTMSGLETVVLPGNILEIDILPNRSDCWSIRGIAREVAALTKSKVRTPKFRLKEASKKTSQVLKVEVRDRRACPRYMARVVENVKVGGSPAWLKKRLEQAGVRSINNVVDVTNYLLLELGQPMHAFDASLIAGDEIIVRKANSKEKIVALDEKEYQLDADMLVIADTEKAIALAGVMGAINTEVSATTQKVVLESAFFDPILVHKTSKALKLRSESSVRFEHGVDWNAVEEALDRAAAMIAEIGKGKALRGKVDVKGKVPKPKVIELRPEKVNRVLGTEIAEMEMKAILKRLAFGVSGKRVEIPLFRAADISREIDLIEEIARIYGYGRINASMPSTAFPGKEVDKEDVLRTKITEIMAGCGLFEVQTYSMLGPKDFEKVGLSAEQAVKINNPMNIEESLMRTSLLLGILNVLVHNLNRQIENVFVFEIGKVYLPSSQKLPREKWMLCAAATGSPFMSALDKGQVEYFYAKGILENLLVSLGVDDYRFIETINHLLHPGKGAEITGLGFLGELHPDIKRNYELDKSICFFEIDLDALFAKLKEERRYRPLPKFPSVARDIAMFVPKGIEHQMITTIIRKVGADLVERVYLFDKYKDSLAYRIVYRNKERTLTDVEVNNRHLEITRTLETKLNVRVRK